MHWRHLQLQGLRWLPVTARPQHWHPPVAEMAKLPPILLETVPGSPLPRGWAWPLEQHQELRYPVKAKLPPGMTAC
ncbi:hypothetical protein D3C71_2045150 [compost metagenome]